MGIFCGGLNAYCMRIWPLFLRTSGSSGVLKALLLERNRQLSCNPKKKKKKKKSSLVLQGCLSTAQAAAGIDRCHSSNHAWSSSAGQLACQHSSSQAAARGDRGTPAQCPWGYQCPWINGMPAEALSVWA